MAKEKIKTKLFTMNIEVHDFEKYKKYAKQKDMHLNKLIISLLENEELPKTKRLSKVELLDIKAFRLLVSIEKEMVEIAKSKIDNFIIVSKLVDISNKINEL